jgi:hypothetical protein
MPRSFRFPGRPFAASEPAPKTTGPPELEQLDRGAETAGLALADPVEVEEIEGPTAASGPEAHPAPAEGDTALEGPTWQEEFASPDQLHRRFKDVDRLRGRLANEVGQLRRQVGLYERIIVLIGRTTHPVERQALVQAAGLIRDPRALSTIEEMVDLGEEAA